MGLRSTGYRWIAFAAFFALAVGVLAYGYWFNATHGALYFVVNDPGSPQRMPSPPIQLALIDAQGSVRAEAATGDAYGTIYLSAPQEYSCREAESQAVLSRAAQDDWQRCFERQSRWIPTWAREIRAVNLKAADCVLQLPVVIIEHGDLWWFWWIPLRHIGGKPYTSFRVVVNFNSKTCTPA